MTNRSIKGDDFYGKFDYIIKCCFTTIFLNSTNGTCSSFRRWVFEPNQKTNNVKNMVEDGHFVSSIFMQEVVAC